MKEIYGSLDNIVQSQIHQVQDLHSLEGQIILIVSHPWHRLVSLYRTHYEQFNYNQYQLYGYEMAHNGLIGKVSKLLPPSKSPTSYISLSSLFTAWIWRPLENDQKHVGHLRLLPTFIDFVDYILKHRNILQWIPIADLCPVCTGAFDYIFRLEEMVQLMGSSVDTYKYMSKLNETQVEKLKNMYWKDFAFFEYNSKDY